MLRPFITALLLVVTITPTQDKPIDPNSFPKSTVALADGLSFADNLTIRAPRNFLRDYPSRDEAGLVNAVIEIPSGACEKWEVKSDGSMRWDMKDGKPRHVKYLGYPCNYGMVPRTLLSKELGGDGDPLDMLVLGPALPRGTVIPVRVLGVIHLVDGGAKDDKLIAVPQHSALGKAGSVTQLDELFPGITPILRTWFENYKGKGALQCGGFADQAEADALLVATMKAFEASESAAKQSGK